MRWRDAMELALYGDRGFFRISSPAAHFRTSAHTGTVFAQAITTLLERIDAALDHPDRLDCIDVGAGRGELLEHVRTFVSPAIRARLNPVAVEIARRPDTLDDSISWVTCPPEPITGLLIATEWLDNVPLDIAERGHYVNVDRDGVESIGDPLDPTDRAWLDHWWPDGDRAEIGSPRDAAWAAAVAGIDAGLALAVDYGHLRERRPPFGTLTGFRSGRDIPPIPDGSGDLTAHVAADSVAAAGSAVAGLPAHVVRQAEALRALGVTGKRPDLRLATTDPTGYVRALAAASSAAELTDRSGLGDHFWIQQPVAIPW